MASFGTTTALSSDGKFGLTFDWTVESKSVANNTSTIKWMVTLYTYTSTGVSSAYKSSFLNVKVNGVQNGYTGVDFSLSGNSHKVLKSGTTVITHNTDGSKTFAYSFSGAVNTDSINVRGSGSGVLDPIPQKATISSAPSFSDADRPTITYSNPSGSLVDSLQACISSNDGGTIYVPYRDISKTGSSYTFNLSSAERSALMSAATGTTLEVRFYIKTVVDGVTYYDYSPVKIFTITDAKPTLTVSVSDVNTTTVALTGGGNKFIPGNNSMKFTITANARTGATIVSYTAICGSQTIRAASGTFTNIENDVVSFAVTDSRGLTTTKTVQLEAIDYVKLTCNQKVQMLLEDESNAQMHLTISGNFYNGSFGAKNNALTIYTRHKRNNGDWIDWVDLTPLLYSTDGNTYKLTADLSNFDPSGTYTFQCKTVDALGEAVTGEYAVKFTPVFDWSKDDFNFNVPVTIEGDPLNDYVIEYGTESMGSNGTWYWSKWKSGKAECYGRRNYGNMAVTTAWGNLYRSATFNQSIPYGLFKSVPEVIDITFSTSNFGAWIAKHEASAPTATDTGSFIVVRPASATLSQAYVSFNVIGRWK